MNADVISGQTTFESYLIDRFLVICGQVVIHGNGARINRMGGTVFGINTGAYLELHHTRIYDSGHATALSYGGGINNGGTVYLYDSEIIGNKALYGGGGMINRGTSYAIRTRFISNEASAGAAIQNDGGGTTDISCSLFNNNGRNDTNNVRAANVVNGNQQNSSGSVIIRNSAFGSVRAGQNPLEIENYMASTTLPVDAVGNWWYYLVSGTEFPRPPSVGPGASVITTPALAANPTTASSILPECVPVPPVVPSLLTPTPLPILPYKIRFSNELGLPASNWTTAEILAIENAVRYVGEALQIELNTTTPQEAFNRVMVNGDQPEYVYFYKSDGTTSNLNIQYLPGAPQNILGYTVNVGGCRTLNSLPRTVICNNGNSALTFPEYAIVHELGHVFTNRSRHISTDAEEQNRGLLFAALDNTYSGECSPALSLPNLFENSQFTSNCLSINDTREEDGVVLGVLRNTGDWARGVRGWGTSPNTQLTAFQQHPLAYFGTTDPIDVVDETAADMFLNWVYRRRTNNPPTFRTTTATSEPWQGFANIDGNGNFDSNYPGDARFAWMNIVMSEIIRVKGW